MVTQFTVKSDPLHLHIVCAGPYHLTDGMALIQRIREECERSGCDHVLLDLRPIIGSMPNLQRYQLGERAAEELRCRLGIISRIEDINRFFENVASNRGLKTYVGSEADDVWQWLWKK